MKVAIFQSHDEIIILQVKGRKRSSESVDGFDKIFAEDMDRDIKNYTVTFCHIGSGSGIFLYPQIRTDWLDHEEDITDWFYNEDEDE